MSRKKVGLQWRKRTIVVQKCTTIVDHAGSALVLPTHVFWKAIIEISKIHNVFM